MESLNVVLGRHPLIIKLVMSVSSMAIQFLYVLPKILFLQKMDRLIFQEMVMENFGWAETGMLLIG